MTIKIEKVGGPEIEAAVAANDGYCPCAVCHEPDTKCMCLEFRLSTTSGLCQCGLYKKTITED